MVKPIELSEADITRFWLNVNMRGPTECWDWTAGCDRGDYGIFYDCNYVAYRTHRVAFAIANGDTDLCVLHHCDNSRCCNFAHLFAGTPGDGRRDHVDKERAFTQLNESTVQGVRARFSNGWPQRDLAEEYGITLSQVVRICRDIHI